MTSSVPGSSPDPCLRISTKNALSLDFSKPAFAEAASRTNKAAQAFIPNRFPCDTSEFHPTLGFDLDEFTVIDGKKRNPPSDEILPQIKKFQSALESLIEQDQQSLNIKAYADWAVLSTALNNRPETCVYYMGECLKQNAPN